MQAPRHHILVCSSSRVAGVADGTCKRRDAPALIQYIEEGLSERGIDNCLVSNTGCLKMCDKGPVMVVHPQNWWYGKIDENSVDAILDALADGKPCAEHQLA